MEKIKLREEYTIRQLIEMLTKDYWVINHSNPKPCCPDIGLFDFYIYAYPYEGPIYEDLVCYVEEPPQITDEDKEIFPDFVMEKGLSFLYSGENFETVIEVVFDQKPEPSAEEWMDSLNYYRIYDAFLELGETEKEANAED